MENLHEQTLHLGTHPNYHKSGLPFNRKSLKNLPEIYQPACHHYYRHHSSPRNHKSTKLSSPSIFEKMHLSTPPPSFLEIEGEIAAVLAIGKDVATLRQTIFKVECTEGSGSGRLLSANKIKGPDLADSSRPKDTRGTTCLRSR